MDMTDNFPLIARCADKERRDYSVADDTNTSHQGTKDPIAELCKKEHRFLRDELGHLKECQIRFLTFSVTTTGLILGITGRFRASLSSQGMDLPSGLLALLPLLVLIPSWWIFFDKATTVTRIVGYFRVIERLLLGYTAGNFTGWESALAEYRKETIGKKLRLKELAGLLAFRTTHRYWVITYYVFLLLSAVCTILGWAGISPRHLSFSLIVIVASTLIVLASSSYNARTLWALVYGEYSYGFHEERWKTILKIVPGKSMQE
jgi:hypothetical protein